MIAAIDITGIPINNEDQLKELFPSSTYISADNDDADDIDNQDNNVKKSSPNRIAFGSCNDQDMENRLWNVVESRKPSGFIWGGDAIYAGKRLNRVGILFIILHDKYM